MSQGRPIRLRTRTLVMVLAAIAVIALSGGTYLIDRSGEAIIASRQLAVAQSARDYFVAFAHEEGLAPLARALDRRERNPNAEAFHYSLFSSGGRLIGGAHLLNWDQLPSPGEAQTVYDVGVRGSSWQVLVQPISTGGVLVVYEDLSERVAFRRTLVTAAFFALALALAAVLLASFGLTRMLYRRTEQIAATASRIAEGKTSARAPADPHGDVFDRLGVSINTMLDRNEELLTGLRTVTDSLAHDLRSPLTRMKSALARAQAPDCDAAARADLIGTAGEEADRTLATISALLDIARAETGLSRDMFQPVDVAALVEEMGELFGPVLEDASQTLQIEPPAEPVLVSAHGLLLRQALGNLLFNAAKYAGAGAEVRMAVLVGSDCVRFIVADTGPGIAQADRGRVQERFVRLDTARTTSGSGLGLAIAAACAKLHRGRLLLEDNHPGLRVVLEIAR